MTPAEREEWDGILRWMEVPEMEACHVRGCPVKPLRCFCWDACRAPDDDESPAGPRGTCDCPVRPPPPCEHVLSRDHDMAINRWARLLELVWPDEYVEPPRGKPAKRIIGREARVSLLTDRREAGLSLWHPADVMADEDAVDDVGRKVRMTQGNFRPREGGLLTKREAA